MNVRPLDRSAKRELLRGTPLFAVLKPAELDHLVGFTLERRFARGSTIMEYGSEGSNMLVLATGRARVTANAPNGKEVTLSILGPGMTVGEMGLLDGQPRSATVSAMDDCLTLVIERRDFLPFLHGNGDLALRLLGVLCERLRGTNQALENIALMDLPSRLARLLIKLGQEYGVAGPRGLTIRLKLTQTDLSTFVAATRESVNRQMRAWEEEGLLREEDGYLMIRAPEALQAIAE
ncbi:MAG TPA: Crp/Fnr family transcriptional regulator [Acetobacteraceae bacterium]